MDPSDPLWTESAQYARLMNPRRMLVMPSNSCGWFVKTLAHETTRLGHLYSPGQQRGPWGFLPYAMDNGAYSCWNQADNTFDEVRWAATEVEWRRLLFWAQAAPIKPLWAIVPDVPGDAAATIARWAKYAPEIQAAGFPLAVAVQDGMTSEDVWELDPAPEVICVGGTTAWKWESLWIWCHDFDHVHLLRCNSPDKLDYVESLGVESCDGTGWNRGDRKLTEGLEAWCRRGAVASTEPLWPHVSRAQARDQLFFA